MTFATKTNPTTLLQIELEMALFSKDMSRELLESKSFVTSWLVGFMACQSILGHLMPMSVSFLQAITWFQGEFTYKLYDFKYSNQILTISKQIHWWDPVSYYYSGLEWTQE